MSVPAAHRWITKCSCTIQASDEKYILCTIIKKNGSAPRGVGTQMLVSSTIALSDYRWRLCGGRGYKPLQETVSQAGV